MFLRDTVKSKCHHRFENSSGKRPQWALRLSESTGSSQQQPVFGTFEFSASANLDHSCFDLSLWVVSDHETFLVFPAISVAGYRRRGGWPDRSDVVGTSATDVQCRYGAQGLDIQ